MHQEERVAVIIPTFRRDEATVLRAVKSALAQTHANLELVVVDDSPDSFVGRDAVRDALAAVGDPRVSYVRHAENRGACAARNTGLARSSAPYVAFLDDDDEWLPEKIEKQLERLHEAGDACGLVGCGSVTVDDETGLSRKRAARYARGMVFDRLILENFIGSTSFPLIRRRCLDAVGPFDVLMKSAQDYELWLRLAARYRVDTVDAPLVLYHVNGDARISVNEKNRIQGLERLDEIHAGYLRAHPAARSARLIKLAPHYLGAGQRDRARRALLEAMRHRPLSVLKNMSLLKLLVKR